MAAGSLYMTHYYYPGTEPMGNIMLLPEAEAFRLAAELAANHPETTSLYRFADFINYYPLRKAADAEVRRLFQALGGKPVLEHPYSFVLFESDYLKDWFGNGGTVRLPVTSIPEDQISFTYGDSCSNYQRRGAVDLIDRRTLLAEVAQFPGTLEDYAVHIQSTCRYIEVQVWSHIPEIL